MTNEEAINKLNSLKDYYNDKNEDSYVGFDNEDNEAINKAIKALEQQPSEDCISREETLKAFAEKCGGECACCEYNGSGYDAAENCKLIKSMPSVTPKAEWIPVSEKLPNSYEYVLATMISPVTQLPFVCKLYTGENAKEKIEESKVIAWTVLPKPYKEKK